MAGGDDRFHRRRRADQQRLDRAVAAVAHPAAQAPAVAFSTVQPRYQTPCTRPEITTRTAMSPPLIASAAANSVLNATRTAPCAHRRERRLVGHFVGAAAGPTWTSALRRSRSQSASGSARASSPRAAGPRRRALLGLDQRPRQDDDRRPTPRRRTASPAPPAARRQRAPRSRACGPGVDIVRAPEPVGARLPRFGSGGARVRIAIVGCAAPQRTPGSAGRPPGCRRPRRAAWQRCRRARRAGCSPSSSPRRRTAPRRPSRPARPSRPRP